MKLVLIGRLVALALSGGTFAFLFINDSWRADNIFLIPDLILSALLLAAAVLPGRIAVPALAAAFSFKAGVLTTSVNADAIVGRDSIAGVFGMVTAWVMAALMVTVAVAGAPRR